MSQALVDYEGDSDEDEEDENDILNPKRVRFSWFIEFSASVNEMNRELRILLLDITRTGGTSTTTRNETCWVNSIFLDGD